jgi:L-alanine-DL-glutamate epimerase-like enolase superfamily enzyme
MRLSYYPYTLILKKQFTISTHSRSTTPIVMVEIKGDGLIGYGEASLPPYLKEDQTSVINFLKKVDFSEFKDPLQINEILDYVINIEPGNFAAKAAVDIALHDLACKQLNIPLYKYLKINKKDDIYTSFTIGISDIKSLQQKIEKASDFKILKIKLGTENDKQIIETIRSITNVLLYVDVNQGWSDKYFALDIVNWLAEQNVVLVEQPFTKENYLDSRWLSERSPIPIIADEAIQTINDFEKAVYNFSGVNIKLMKAGGIREAHKMILKAKSLGLKVMIGCMTETSCAISAASHLASLADWVDLDGAELIANDLFTGMKIQDGKLIIPEIAGLGIEKIQNLQV